MPPQLPYCGAPPVPNTIWSRWNLDPVLIAILIAAVLGYIWGAARLNRKTGVLGERRQALFYCGWVLTSLALVSPLCSLSVALFSARVGQHVILTMAAAPLIAAGMPAAALSALLPHRFENCADPLATSPLISAALFALCLWFWHTPHAYAETFTSVLMYWLMHLTLFGSAIWLWAGLINDRPATTLQAAAASVVSSIQMGLLGAIIMFAPHPLYSPHALTTATWGLSQLQDQQLGGVIMWVPGCIIFLTVALLRLMAILRPPVWEQRVSFFPLEQARSRMDL